MRITSHKILSSVAFGTSVGLAQIFGVMSLWFLAWLGLVFGLGVFALLTAILAMPLPISLAPALVHARFEDTRWAPTASLASTVILSIVGRLHARNGVLRST